ncbi:glycosyltransferase family 4 protein [Nocardia sp. JMUB6875]
MSAHIPLPVPATATVEFPSSERNRLRIAMVVPPYFDIPPKAYGGVEAVVADLVDALVERGHRVTLLGAGVNGTKGEFESLWDRAQSERLGDPFPEVVHALKARRALERLAATEGLDLVHDHTFAGPLNMPVSRELGLPTVVTVHGPVDGDPYIYYRELGDDAHLVAISDRQRSLAPDLNWVGRVHNALRVEDWPFQTEKHDYALFLGRFTADKAPHLALEAAHTAGLPLILAGKCAEPPEVRYFESAVRPLLTEHDHMFGMADATAKRELLSRARCLVFPVQWEEPFGMVMIEAMVCGTPVVALRGGAVAEVIVDGVTGRVCDDPAELPAAIKEVQDYDPHAMRAHVAAHFGADTLGGGYEEIYRRVVREHRPRRTGRITIHTWGSAPTHQTAAAPVRAAGTGPGRATASTVTARGTSHTGHPDALTGGELTPGRKPVSDSASTPKATSRRRRVPRRKGLHEQ